MFSFDNQSNIHYAMPVKNMMYDILQYGEKVKAYLQRGARRLPGFTEYRMHRWGMEN